MNIYLKKAWAAAILPALMLYSCTPESTGPGNTSENLPADFKYNTTRNIALNLNAKTTLGVKMQGAKISIFSSKSTDANGVVHYGGQLAAGAVDADGILNTAFQAATSVDSVYAVTYYPGLLNEVKISIKAGGEISANMVPVYVPSSGRVSSDICDGNGYERLTCWDNDGVPKNNPAVIQPMQSISNTMLSNIYYTLPEGKRIGADPDRSDLIVENADILLRDRATVYITWVSEAAGNRNALGFFTYNRNNVPTGPNDAARIITKRTIIFPNTSLPGSGGNLPSGFRMKLGVFDANTGIGFFCVNNGWNGNTVNNPNETFYSRSSWNPESTAELRNHMVLLNDPESQKYIIGFEDLNRETGGCDHDFNDVLFYADADPYTAIDGNDLPEVIVPKDTDGDGVNDDQDDYPTDHDRAFNNYTPNATDFASLCYEDLWPSTGDFDMNDLVVGYNYNVVTNAANKVVEMKAKFKTRAIGASYNNGFGLQFDLAPDKITSVTDSTPAMRAGTETTAAANGTEAGVTDKATVIVFNQAAKTAAPYSGSFYNTVQSATHYTSPVLKMNVNFVRNTYTIAQLGAAPYNPFIFIHHIRANEVHLADQRPTMLANLAKLGTGSDKSVPASNVFYRASNNMPFALHILNFDYPVEKADIRSAYNKFTPWAQSHGTTYADWYSNPAYRDASKVYVP
ncbi:MAG: LruC domain-containing protein [Bacteroidota bacterium]